MKVRWRCGQPFSTLWNMYLLCNKPSWKIAFFLEDGQKMNKVVSENSSHTFQAKIWFKVCVCGICIIKHWISWSCFLKGSDGTTSIES